MPHIIVKLWPGKSEKQKKQLAEAIVEQGMAVSDHSTITYALQIGSRAV